MAAEKYKDVSSEKAADTAAFGSGETHLDEIFDLARRHDNAAQVRIIALLRREEPEAVRVILRHFKNGDKFAAELLIRTFYPYAENLLVALESRSPHNRMASQSSVAPSLTVAGSKRAEILNDFFVRLVKDAPESDLRSGIKLYIYRSFMDSFSKRMRSFSSRDGLEAVKSGAKGSKQPSAAEASAKNSDSFEAMFSYDTFKESPESRKSCENKIAADSSEAAAVKREQKRITGIPASGPVENVKSARRNESAAVRTKTEDARTVREFKGAASVGNAAAQGQQRMAKAEVSGAPRTLSSQAADTAYARWQAQNSRSPLLAAETHKSREVGGALNGNNPKANRDVSAAEGRADGSSAPRLLRHNKTSALMGGISKNGSCMVMKPSEDMKIHAALQDKDIKANLAPSLPDTRSVEEIGDGYRDLSEEEIKASLSARAKYVLNALNSLASSDTEAYRYVVMRYFVGRTFAQLSQDFEVKSSADIGMQLLRGLKAIIKNTPLT